MGNDLRSAGFDGLFRGKMFISFMFENLQNYSELGSKLISCSDQFRKGQGKYFVNITCNYPREIQQNVILIQPKNYFKACKKIFPSRPRTSLPLSHVLSLMCSRSFNRCAITRRSISCTCLELLSFKVLSCELKKHRRTAD